MAVTLFKTGDVVLVEKSGKRLRASKHWNNKWVPTMDTYVGKCFIVNHVNGHGVNLGDYGFEFPPSVLRLIKRGEKMFLKEGDRVRVTKDALSLIKQMRDTVGQVFVIDKKATRSGGQELVRLSNGYIYLVSLLELVTDYEDDVPDDEDDVPDDEDDVPDDENPVPPKFKVGDKVVLERDSDWRGFTSVMRKFIGKAGTIHCIDGGNFETAIVSGFGGYFYPTDCLELVDKPEAPAPAVFLPLEDYERF